MTLRPYQLAPVAFLAKRKRALVVAPAGSGKTLMAAAAVLKVINAKNRNVNPVVGWIANTREQVQQAYKAMFNVFTGEDVDVNIAEWKWNAYAPVAPVTFKAACAAADCDWSFYDLLIVDECHHAPAKGWSFQIETCQGARWGFTATPDAEGDDAMERDAVLCELFGTEWFVVNREEVGTQVSKAKVVLLNASDKDARSRIDDGIEQALNRWTYPVKKKCEMAIQQARRRGAVNPATIHAMMIPWERAKQDMWPRAAWFSCVENGIVKNEVRNSMAIHQTLRSLDKGNTTLVLVNQVEHAKEFANAIEFRTEIAATACYSGMGAKARRHALYDFKTGKLKCLVATSLADEGLDVPRASVLVLVSGGKSRAKAEQRTGRVLREFAGKETAVIYDFEDRFHPLMAKHALARQAVYRNLGYEITHE